MHLFLTALSGPDKGTSWPILKEGLVIGRSPECDVGISDRIVSRRHCRIVLKKDKVRFEDLDSENPALINGVPSRDGVLKAGDEIALGRHLFLVVSGAQTAGLSADADAGLSTDSLGGKKVICFEGDIGALTDRVRPRTVQDLAMLHSAYLELSSASDMGELTEVLRKHLHERFNQRMHWIGRVDFDGELSVQDQGGEESVSGLPQAMVRKAIREKRGLLTYENRKEGGHMVRVSTLIAPVTFGEVGIGFIALQTETPHGVYQEVDLQILVLLSHSLGPLIHAVENLDRLRRENERLRAETDQPMTLVGRSKGIRRVRSQIATAAKSELIVLITGETGTGKELAARLLHTQSSRSAGPFIVVNCAAIPGELFESVLFGYEKGAFTGAHEASEGLVAQADGGTLFLDEIGDLSLDNQARILRAIESHRFRRIGAKQETYIDFRVVAATNRDIQAAIKKGVFRQDLYHRINTFEIHISSLDKRRADIQLLAEHFFQLAKANAKRPLCEIASEAVAHLQSRSWPGNVRQLRNCIDRAVSTAQKEVVGLQDFAQLSDEGETLPSEEPPITLAEAEKRHISAVLDKCGGNIRRAAKVLEIGRSTLYNKIAEYDIEHK